MEIIFAFDNDEAGRKAIARNSKIISDFQEFYSQGPVEFWPVRKWIQWDKCDERSVCGEWIDVEPEKPKLTKQEIKEKIAHLKSKIFSLEEYKQKLENVVRERSAFANHWFCYMVIEHLFVPELPALRKELRRLEWQLPIKIKFEGEVTAQHIQQAKQVPLTNFVHINRGNFVRCPFHEEKTASFKYYPKNNSWYCFGQCAEGGDSIAFIMKLHGIPFLEAVKFLLKM